MAGPEGTLPVTKMPVTTAAPANAPALRFQPFLGITRFANLGSGTQVSRGISGETLASLGRGGEVVELHNWALPILAALERECVASACVMPHDHWANLVS